jgi:peptidoglycan-associated lipoprotein
MTQSIKKFSNLFAIMLITSFLAACATAPTETSSSTTNTTSQSEVVGGIYVGTDTVEMLAIDVPDRVFFAYDSYSLAASAQTTLNKQAKWLKANPSVAIAVEGHADERGTREYNLALGDRRASSVKDYLMSQGISSNRISTISYGKERPVKSGSNDTAWAQNRRSVSVRTN